MANFNLYITRLDYSWLIDFMIENGTLMRYRRNEPYCLFGKPCKTMGFIHKGAFIYTAYDSKGERHVVSYAFENSFVGDYASFRLKEPPKVYITALHDSEVYLMTNKALNQMMTENTENRDRLLHMTEILYSETYRRLIAAYIRTAEERYAEILHRCPDIFSYTTAKDLASYLRITPETLSRIRRKMREQ